MSEELSFTQALREQGFTQSSENTQNNNNEKTIEKVEETETSNQTQTIQEEKSNNKSVEDNNSDDENIMYIGSRSVMNYVLNIVNNINDGSDVVTVMARGRAINKAVDVVEVVRHRFITDLKIDDISISTQQITRDDGRESNVSAISIRIIK